MHIDKEDLRLLQRHRLAVECSWPAVGSPDHVGLVRAQKFGWLSVKPIRKGWVRVECTDAGMDIIRQHEGGAQ